MDMESMYKLDVGCGIGRWVKEESRHKEDFIIGVDKEAYREWSKSKRLNVLFIIADTRHLPFKSKVFDYVRSDCMSPLNADGICEAANEMQKVLREGEVYFSVHAFSPEEGRVKLWEKRDMRMKELRKSGYANQAPSRV
ncbi:MAG: class I SAM-dependent methyltransferase [Candidatus Aenigmarchaeota archaeon]|nr:class I SAM-dependent methyltransferase [Candidatus Aenigmarchaeota archaeon]